MSRASVDRLTACALQAALLLTLCSAGAAVAGEDELRVVHEAALALYDRGEYAEALLGFNRSYAIAPKPQSLLMIGRCYQALSRFDEAASTFEKLLADYPDDPLVGRARLHLVESLRDGGAEQLAAGEFLRARTGFETALVLIAMVGEEAAASKPVVLVGLGESLLGLEEWADAKARFMEVDPAVADAGLRARAEKGLELAEAALAAERTLVVAERGAAMRAAVEHERTAKMLDDEIALRWRGRARGYVFMGIGASLAVVAAVFGTVASCYRGCGGPPWEIRSSEIGYVMVLLPVVANVGFSIPGTIIYVKNQLRLGRLRAKRKALGPPPAPAAVRPESVPAAPVP